jgi:hypothetical protein
VGFLFKPEAMKKPSLKSLQLRKERHENRLASYGLDYAVSDIGLFDETQYTFVHPNQAAERLLILLGVAYAAYNFDESEKVMNWLKNENIWQAVSEKEKDFFRNPDPEEGEKQTLSWRFESAYILAWCLKKVSSPPDPGSECKEDQVNEFLKHIPPVGSSSERFFTGLKFVPLSDISDEFLFYKTATAYFQNIRTQDKENTSQVHIKASFERYAALAWIRSSGTGTDWDALTVQVEK